MSKKTLHLVLKYKWYDMIETLIKKEEYREIKEYWEDRLIEKYEEDGKTKERFVDYDIVRFYRGYKKDRKIMDVEFTGIRVGVGKPEWGADEKVRFIISLGEKV